MQDFSSPCRNYQLRKSLINGHHQLRYDCLSGATFPEEYSVMRKANQSISYLIVISILPFITYY